MSAADHLNPRQLKMFMTPNEIMGMEPNPGELETVSEQDDQGYWPERKERPDELWQRKASESDEVELSHSLAHEGIQKPVNITHELHERRQSQARTEGPWLGNGYHRVAALADVGKGNDLIPVTHHANWAETMREANKDWSGGW